MIASLPLDYAGSHNIVSATDFKAIVKSMLREHKYEDVSEIKIIQVNPLSGESRRNAGTVPQQSDLDDYDEIFNQK